MTALEVLRTIGEFLGILGVAFAVLNVNRKIDLMITKQTEMNSDVARAKNDNQAQDIEIASIKAFLEGREGRKFGSGIKEE